MAGGEGGGAHAGRKPGGSEGVVVKKCSTIDKDMKNCANMGGIGKKISENGQKWSTPVISFD